MQEYITKQKTVFKRHRELASSHLRDGSSLHKYLLNDLDNNAFEWAWLVVNSRCIYQALSDTSSRDDNYACAPLIDMINHVPSSVPHCRLSYDISGLSVISNSHYQPGEEVYISYGAHSNEALLCEYGFTIAHDNPDNCLFLDAAIKARLMNHHVSLLMEIDYYEDYTLDSSGWCSFRTEVALRAALLSEKECEEEADGCRRLMQFVNGLSSGRADEAAMFRLLKDVLQVEKTLSIARIERCQAELVHCAPNIMALVVQMWQDRLMLLDRGLGRLHERHRNSGR
jgi:hypothetical protein